jgi:hypothetical protein
LHRIGHAAQREGRREMNNKEILIVVDAVSNEKGVEKEIIFVHRILDLLERHVSNFLN